MSTNRRMPLTTGALLLLGALTVSCIFIKTRPWDNSSQRTRFMLHMSSELIAPVSEDCIEDVYGRLKAKGLAAKEAFSRGQLVLVNGGSGCAKAVAGCGSCHLPARNTSEYEIRYGEGKFVRGRVMGIQGERLLIASGAEKPTAIPLKDINQSVHLRGRDPLHSWWNWKAYGRRGKITKRMLLISAAHGVACVNCHVRHGDFALTGEGRQYQQTRKVIKSVPLKGDGGR